MTPAPSLAPADAERLRWVDTAKGVAILLVVLFHVGRILHQAEVIGDVWLSALMGWVTGRTSPADTAAQMEKAVHLLLRD